MGLGAGVVQERRCRKRLASVLGASGKKKRQLRVRLLNRHRSHADQSSAHNAMMAGGHVRCCKHCLHCRLAVECLCFA